MSVPSLFRAAACRRALLALSVVTAALLGVPLASHAATVSYTANFSVDDVDPWGGAVHEANQLYDVRWNENGYAEDLEDWEGLKFGGSIGGATSGHLGLKFGYDATNGTLDIDYPALVDVTYPDDETYFPGDTIRISTTDRSSAGSFEFDPGAQDYKVTTQLAVAARASGELCFVSCFGTIPFFPPFSQGETEIDVLHAHANAGQYGDIWDPPLGSSRAHVSGDVKLTRPDVALDIAQQRHMASDSTHAFGHLDLDIDAFSKQPLGRSFSDGDFALSYDILDGRINLDSDERHRFDFRPTAKLTFAFPRTLSYRVVATDGSIGALQTGTSATIDAGQSLDIVLPVDQTQPFAITPTMTLTNTMRHQLDHTYQVQGTIKILRASAGVPGFTVIPEICFGELGCTPALEFPGLSFSVGPVYSTTIPVATTRPSLLDRTWAVPFAPHQQADRAFDPENIPVAEAGGPYDIDEGSSELLDGTASYDLDSDDVITHSWVLDQPGTLEADGPTPRFDGLDGDQTYVATLTVCDLKQNCHSDTATVNVHNVAPSHVLDTSPTISFGIGQAYLARVGVPVTHSATANDVGTDDTTYTWNAGPTASWTPTTTTYFNGGGGTADLDPSPFGTLPFPSANSSSVTFAQPGIAELLLVVNDDDGGSTSTTVPMLIADTSTTHRPSGWFKQQYSLQGKRVLTSTQLDAYLAFTRSGSWYFDERMPLASAADASVVLRKLDESQATTLEQARASTLAAWLNIASGAVAFEGPLVTRMQQPGRTTNAHALREVEAVLADASSSEAQLVAAMQLAKSIGS